MSTAPLSVEILKYTNQLSHRRLDDIVKTKEDSEYSRLSHYNKGLKLLKETLESEKTQNKGKLIQKFSINLFFFVLRWLYNDIWFKGNLSCIAIHANFN